MISAIQRFFDQHMRPTSKTGGMSGNPVQIAAVALLLEVVKADFHVSDEELQHYGEVAGQVLNLAGVELAEMLELVKAENENATSLHQFTRLINQEFDPEQKFELIAQMWRVALADQQIDKYEEHLIRKTADLIYLPHARFIEAKLLAQSRLS